MADLDARNRSQRLAEAARGAGWPELRHDRGDGDPLASGVEAAIIADALGEADGTSSHRRDRRIRSRPLWTSVGTQPRLAVFRWSR